IGLLASLRPLWNRPPGLSLRHNGTMDSSKFVILGGGMVAGYAAKVFVERGGRPGALTIISADTALPYERPPLTQGLLTGQDEAAAGTRAIVIGGGFIAMEAASSLAQRGVEATMVVREDRIWKAFFTEEMSASFRRYYESHGVKFVFGSGIAGFQGSGLVKFV